MQMVFQMPAESFDPRRTLGDGIGESLRNMGIKGTELKTKVDNLLELCGLTPEFASRYPHQVSGGQCQRAAIARAVYTHPTILLGDELTGNLDSRTSASVMELLKKISRQYQQTMLVVTHDKKVAAMADRIIRMKDGRVVEDERL